MLLLRREECPLCHGRDISPYIKGTFSPDRLQADDFRITDSRYGLRWNFDACRECGYVFSNPSLSEQDLVGFYSGLKDEEYGRESENRAKNFQGILRCLHRFHPPERTLLDVGAASGIFLNVARAEGYEVCGIEPSAFLVSEARRKYNMDLFCGTLDSFHTGQRYGAVALLDILEHVADPDRLVAKASALNAEKGIIVVVTPDISSLAAKLVGRRWWHFRIAHIQFFNKKSLAYLLQKHGYEIIAIKHYSWNFSLQYLLSRLFSSLKREGTLQKLLKKLNLRLQLFDSLEVYARKTKD